MFRQGLQEAFKAFFDRLRRCDATHNHFLTEKRCVLIACAGGTGRGTLECLTQLERGLTHMGMRAYDRIPVVRYNRDYILPALYEAGKHTRTVWSTDSICTINLRQEEAPAL